MSYNQLDVFDFDGTLFRSPVDSAENKKLYEKHTGIPWHITKDMAAALTKKLKRQVRSRSGWWGKGETLQPPLVPDPAPAELWNSAVVADFLASKANPNVLTTIMTGRHTGLKKEVFRIMWDGKHVQIDRRTGDDGSHFYEQADDKVQIYLLGMDGPAPEKARGPKPTSTREWKTWLVEQHLDLYPTIEKVRFWEDRPEHAEHFESLSDVLGIETNVTLIVH